MAAGDRSRGSPIALGFVRAKRGFVALRFARVTFTKIMASRPAT